MEDKKQAQQTVKEQTENSVKQSSAMVARPAGKRQTGWCGQQYNANDDVSTCPFGFACRPDGVLRVALTHNLMTSSTGWSINGQQTDGANGQWTDDTNG